ncbi:MAG TPA: MFS transporter [Nitrososphaera sp.]|nr:MFS transporter [Nitrososphaera sp.]
MYVLNTDQEVGGVPAVRTNDRTKRILSSNAEASLSLIIARIVYGINWFNVAAIFPLIALEYGKDVSLLGSVSSAFFIGIGSFQIPAGVFAARFDPRISAIVGITITSTAALLCGLIFSPSQLIWLRFLVGFGMAFFFSSAVILITRYGKRGFPGFSIGVMNSAHSLGGIIGIFAWLMIAQTVGWRNSLVLSGALGIITALLMILTIRQSNKTMPWDNDKIDNREYHYTSRAEKFKIVDTLRVLSNRTLVCLGLILIGIQAAWAVELTFIVIYLVNLGFSAELIGIIASLPLIFAIVSAPAIGRIHDKVGDTRTLLVMCGVGTSLALGGLSTDVIYIILPSVMLTGIFSGGAFTVVYEKARTVKIDGVLDHRNKKPTLPTTLDTGRRNFEDRSPARSDYSYLDTLKVAWVNGLSLIGVLWTPVSFSYIVQESSYELAWIFTAVVTAAFVITPIKFLK